MKTPKTLSLLRAAVCRITLVVLAMGGIQTASALDQPTRALAYSCYINSFWNPVGLNGSSSGFFINQQGMTNQQMSFWTMAETIEVVEDATGVGADTISRVNMGCINFTNNNNNYWTWNTFNDDLAWAQMAFMRAYNMTGNAEWRTLAKNAADAEWARGWDTVNGGMYQQGSSGGKCTCANGNTGIAAYMLYQSLGDSTYLTRAQDEYNWIKTNCFNASTGAVEQGPGSQVYFTYDNGCFATLSFDLGDTTSANLTSDWVTNTYGTSMESFGQGSDAGGFNGICLRGLARIGHNIPFLQAVCDKAWSERNTSGLTSVSFGSQTPSGTDLWCWDCSDMIAGMMCVPAIPASIVSGTIYQLEPQNALGTRLDVIGQGGSGTKMDIYTSNNGNGQKFQINAVSGESGVYTLTPQCSTGSRLDVVGSGTVPGTLVDIWTAGGGLNQNWVIIPVNEANHVYMLQPQNASALRLDVVASGGSGSAVDVWTANDGNNQQWIFH